MLDKEVEYLSALSYADFMEFYRETLLKPNAGAAQGWWFDEWFGACCGARGTGVVDDLGQQRRQFLACRSFS